MRKLIILSFPLILLLIFLSLKEDGQKVAGSPPEDKKNIEKKHPGRKVSSESKELNLNSSPLKRKRSDKKILRVNLDNYFLDNERFKLDYKDGFIISHKLRAISVENFSLKPLGKKIFKKGGFIYYESPHNHENPLESSVESLPVVRRKNGGRIGILTGKISFTLNDGEDVSKVIDEGVNIITENSHINHYLVECHEQEALQEVFENINANESVYSAELEIIQYEPHAK